MEIVRLCVAIQLKKAQIAGSVSTAAEFHSMSAHLKFSKIWEDVQTTPIEVDTISLDVAVEEQFFFTQTDGEDATAEQPLERKEPPRKESTDWVANG